MSKQLGEAIATKTQRFEVSLEVEELTWQQYQRIGDFAVYEPKNPAASEDGHVYVDFKNWQVDSQQQKGTVLSIILIRKVETPE